jgi:NAD(P)-dependent dehydrogenase (short-subunit alcohol dehydrogenase family)
MDKAFLSLIRNCTPEEPLCQRYFHKTLKDLIKRRHASAIVPLDDLAALSGLPSGWIGNAIDSHIISRIHAIHDASWFNGLRGRLACLKAGLMDRGARIFAMTSIGGSPAVPNYGPVSAAKATLEAQIRQLAVELAPAGSTAYAILAGVTDTNALRQIPGYEKIMEVARQRNPVA